MDNIVAENGNVVGTIGHLNLLYAFARKRSERYRQSFSSDDYKWILGAKVVHDLEMTQHLSYYMHAAEIGEHSTLFGIPVEIDYYNPENVQLWENITDKI